MGNKSLCAYCLSHENLRIKCKHGHNVCHNCAILLKEEYENNVMDKSKIIRYKKYIESKRIPRRLKNARCFLCNEKIFLYENQKENGYRTMICKHHINIFEEKFRFIYTITKDVTALCAYARREDAEINLRNLESRYEDEEEKPEFEIIEIKFLATKIRKFS